MPRSGRDCCGSNKDLIALSETTFAVSWFEVCKTSKFSPKGNGMLLFAACKK